MQQLRVPVLDPSRDMRSSYHGSAHRQKPQKGQRVPEVGGVSRQSPQEKLSREGDDTTHDQVPFFQRFTANTHEAQESGSSVRVPEVAAFLANRRKRT